MANEDHHSPPPSKGAVEIDGLDQVAQFNAASSYLGPSQIATPSHYSPKPNTPYSNSGYPSPAQPQMYNAHGTPVAQLPYGSPYVYSETNHSPYPANPRETTYSHHQPPPTYNTPLTNPPSPYRPGSQSHSGRVTRQKPGTSVLGPKASRVTKRATKTRSRGKHEKEKYTPVLKKAISVLCKERNIRDDEDIDIDAFVHRSDEIRQAEVAARKCKTVPRPMNVFMVYRKAYQKRLKKLGKNLFTNHQVISQESGCSWKIETPEVRARFKALADREREGHDKAFPKYKFQPKKTKNKKTQRKSKEVCQSESEDAKDALPDWEADDQPQQSAYQQYHIPRQPLLQPQPPATPSSLSPYTALNRSNYSTVHPCKPAPMPYTDQVDHGTYLQQDCEIRPQQLPNQGLHYSVPVQSSHIENVYYRQTHSPGMGHTSVSPYQNAAQLPLDDGYDLYQDQAHHMPASAHAQAQQAQYDLVENVVFVGGDSNFQDALGLMNPHGADPNAFPLDLPSPQYGGDGGRGGGIHDYHTTLGPDAAESMSHFDPGLLTNGALPHHGLPHDGLSHDGLPYDGLPHHGLSHDGLPYDGLPRVGLPLNRLPASASLSALLSDDDQTSSSLDPALDNLHPDLDGLDDSEWATKTVEANADFEHLLENTRKRED